MVLVFCLFYFFFFKQKTAYEMRISDWSSDVCSSDLDREGEPRLLCGDAGRQRHPRRPHRGPARRRPPLQLPLGQRRTSAARPPIVELCLTGQAPLDRKTAVMGKLEAVRVGIGGLGIIKKNKITTNHRDNTLRLRTKK